MRVLILGAYGLIGSAIATRLARDGHDVVGLGRSAALGKRLLPRIAWIGADLATLTAPDAWRRHLAGVDVVVNASGALQDGAKDNLRAAQAESIRALIAACEAEGVKRFVQISAPGVTADASTAFYRTKAEADAALRASTLDWIIFKPGLVIAPAAYGGTSLIRTLAAFPLVQPVALGASTLQTVGVDDVSDAIARAVAGDAPMRRDYDLVAPDYHTLEHVVARFRAWLGFAPASPLRLPDALSYATAALADLAGWLGWRSPLRTTALRVMDDGVRGDPAPWQRVTGAPLASLDETLALIPSTLQERIYARTQLVFPLLVVTLALFWIASGVIGFLQRDAAMAVLGETVSASVASALVLGGAMLDIAIGLGVLLRAWTRRAALASVLVCAAYLVAGSVLTPALWSDPLGPLVKIFPAVGLALAVAAMAETR